MSRDGRTDTLVVESLAENTGESYCLCIVYCPEGSVMGARIPLGEYTIRRAPDDAWGLQVDRMRGELWLPDRRVSVPHARVWPLQAREGRLGLRDEGSSGGTRANAKHVNECAVGPDDVIRVGTTLLVVCPEQGRPDARWGLFGTSAAMLSVKTLVETVSDSGVTVLILGERGTGKELVARAIHKTSPRRGKVLLTVNSSEVRGDLARSELFGAVRGAYTGAVADTNGLVRAADGGTLFLDEIGDLPLNSQAPLLRVLQEGEVRPVGATRVYHTDVRVIAATNKDLAAEVEQGRFRADLYDRLKTFKIRIPPLRKRKEDVSFLLGHFIGVEGDGPVPSASIMEALLAYDWPGNVRELKAAAGRYLQCAGHGVKGVDLLPEEIKTESVPLS